MAVITAGAEPAQQLQPEGVMTVLIVVRVIAILCIGLLAGIYFGDRTGFAYARAEISASSFVQSQQIIHRHYVKILPPLVGVAVLSGLAWLFMIRSQWRMGEFWLIAASTAAIMFIAAITRAVNVPLNQQLMAWSVAAPPPNFREQWAPWERVHTIRTVVAVSAFVLEAMALGLGRI